MDNDLQLNLDLKTLNRLVANFKGMIYQCMFDAHWTMIFLSKGCQTLTGYTPDELLHNRSISYIDIIFEEHRDYVYQKNLEAITAKESFYLEYRIRHKNGSLIWVSEYSVPVYDAHGEVKMLQGYIQDITEHKNALQSLCDTENRYRSIFENSAEGIFQTNQQGQYLAVNQALANIYGYGSINALIEGLQDINNQLYVEPKRRKQFVKAMDTKGFVHNFESLVYKKDKSTIWISENARKVYDGAGSLLYYEGTVQDITERKQYEDKIEHQATHDSLTGLPNRYLLNDRLQQNIHLCHRLNSRLGVAFIDIDHFKLINDTMGHEEGDRLLSMLSQRIADSIRNVDTVARLGGDEFVVLISNVEDIDNTQSMEGFSIVIQRIFSAIASPFIIDNLDYVVTCSIGLSVFPLHGNTAGMLLKKADIALHEAKRIGRKNCQIYNQSLGDAQSGRLATEYNLRRAIENQEFLLHYQPKVCLLTGDIVGSEALIRWQPAGGKMIPPFEFIDIAEQSGLIVTMGEWVLREACRKTAEWNAKLRVHLSIAVNVSPVQFRQEGFVDTVKSVLDQTGLTPSLLELEITEGLAANDVESFVNKLNQLKQLGVNLAIDDFGTGYSSLAYLKNFPIDCLKIDKTFVSKLEAEPMNAAILKAIVVLGQSLNMNIVAEGVETLYQLEFLQTLGCDMYQGYLFSKPVSEQAFESLMNS